MEAFGRWRSAWSSEVKVDEWKLLIFSEKLWGWILEENLYRLLPSTVLFLLRIWKYLMISVFFFVVFLVCFWGFVCFEIPRQEPNQSLRVLTGVNSFFFWTCFLQRAAWMVEDSEDWLQAPPYRQIDSFNQQQHSEYRGKNGGLSAWLKWMQKPWVECLGYQVTWEVVRWWEKLFEGREIWVQF